MKNTRVIILIYSMTLCIINKANTQESCIIYNLIFDSIANIFDVTSRSEEGRAYYYYYYVDSMAKLNSRDIQTWYSDMIAMPELKKQTFYQRDVSPVLYCEIIDSLHHVEKITVDIWKNLDFSKTKRMSIRVDDLVYERQYNKVAMQFSNVSFSKDDSRAVVYLYMTSGLNSIKSIRLYFLTRLKDDLWAIEQTYSTSL